MDGEERNNKKTNPRSRWHMRAIKIPSFARRSKSSDSKLAPNNAAVLVTSTGSGGSEDQPDNDLNKSGGGLAWEERGRVGESLPTLSAPATVVAGSESKLKSRLGGKISFWKRKSVNITDYDPTYRVVYLGNVLTGWAKGEGCVDKPLSTLWRNHIGSDKADIVMKVTVVGSGLRAVTKEHGLTEYWANRITYCTAHPSYPKVFCWVYRHEGRKMKQELRCHAVLCPKDETAKQMAVNLHNRLHQALIDFKKEKISRQNARLSLANSIHDNPSMPYRKLLLQAGTGCNYKPPIERSKSAPKLTAIEEADQEEEEEEEMEMLMMMMQERGVLHEEMEELEEEEDQDVDVIMDREEHEDDDLGMGIQGHRVPSFRRHHLVLDVEVHQEPGMTSNSEEILPLGPLATGENDTETVASALFRSQSAEPMFDNHIPLPSEVTADDEVVNQHPGITHNVTFHKEHGGDTMYPHEEEDDDEDEDVIKNYLTEAAYHSDHEDEDKDSAQESASPASSQAMSADTPTAVPRAQFLVRHNREPGEEAERASVGSDHSDSGHGGEEAEEVEEEEEEGLLEHPGAEHVVRPDGDALLKPPVVRDQDTISDESGYSDDPRHHHHTTGVQEKRLSVIEDEIDATVQAEGKLPKVERASQSVEDNSSHNSITVLQLSGIHQVQSKDVPSEEVNTETVGPSSPATGNPREPSAVSKKSISTSTHEKVIISNNNINNNMEARINSVNAARTKNNFGDQKHKLEIQVIVDGGTQPPSIHTSVVGGCGHRASSGNINGLDDHDNVCGDCRVLAGNGLSLQDYPYSQLNQLYQLQHTKHSSNTSLPSSLILPGVNNNNTIQVSGGHHHQQEQDGLPQLREKKTTVLVRRSSSDSTVSSTSRTSSADLVSRAADFRHRHPACDDDEDDDDDDYVDDDGVAGDDDAVSAGSTSASSSGSITPIARRASMTTNASTRSINSGTNTTTTRINGEIVERDETSGSPPDPLSDLSVKGVLLSEFTATEKLRYIERSSSLNSKRGNPPPNGKVIMMGPGATNKSMVLNRQEFCINI